MKEIPSCSMMNAHDNPVKSNEEVNLSVVQSNFGLEIVSFIVRFRPPIGTTLSFRITFTLLTCDLIDSR